MGSMGPADPEQIGQELLSVSPVLGQLWVAIPKRSSDVGDVALAYDDHSGLYLVLGPGLFACTPSRRVTIIRQQFLHLVLGHWETVTMLPLDEKWPAALYYCSDSWGQQKGILAPEATLLDWYYQVEKDDSLWVDWLSHPERAFRYRFWRKPHHERGFSHQAFWQYRARVVLERVGRSGLEIGSQMIKLPGSEPGESQISWRKILRSFFQFSGNVVIRHTHQKYSRRYYGSPGLRKTRNARVAVIVDTSASISARDWQRFFDEIHRLKRTGSVVIIIEADAIVQRVWTYHRGIPPQVRGGGGTVFDAALRYAEEEVRPDALVYFTDGQGPVPGYAPEGPLLWVLTEKRTGLPGKSIVLAR